MKASGRKSLPSAAVMVNTGRKLTTVVETAANGDYQGREQPMHDGSYVTVPGGPLFDGITSFTCQAMIWPTTPLKGRQALLGKWCDKAQAGFGLYIDEEGAATLRIGENDNDYTLGL